MCDQNYQQYWFNVPSDPILPDITDNSNLTLVGINNSNPQYTLDVGGNTRTSNLIVNGLIQSSNLLNTATIESTYVDASNITASNGDFFKFNVLSNLYWGGNSLYDTYPGDPSDWDDLIPFSGDYEGMIDQSWIRKPLTAKDVLTDLWNLAEAGIDIAEAIADVSGFLDPAESVIPQAMLDALQSALEEGLDDGGVDSNSVYVSWSNLKSKPIAVSGLDIGVKGDVYLDESKSVYSINSGYITKQGRDNLAITSTTGRDKLMDVGTKEMFPNKINIGSNSLYMDSNTIKFGSNSNIYLNASNTDFKLHSWNFTCNTVSCSNQNTFWQNRIYFSSNVTAPAVATEQVLNGWGYAWWTSTNLTNKYQDTSSSNTQAWTSSFLNQNANTLEFRTKTCNLDYFGEIAPQICQFRVESNGTMFVASNISMSNELVLQCQSNDYVLSNSSLLCLSDKRLKYTVNGSNRFGVNSNGAFFESTQYPRLYGSVEGVEYPNPVDPLSNISMSNFARLEFSFANGLKFGTGLSNNIFNTPYPNLDFFTVTRLGELSTLAQDTVTMEKHFNSNGEFQKSNTIIDKAGNIKVKGSNVILSDGTLRRRANASNVAGWQVSSNGIVTQGNTQYMTDGSIYNSLSSNRLYNASNETLSCEFIGIGTSNPLKDLHIQSVDSFGNDPEEVGIRIQSGDNLANAQLYITAMEGIQSTIGFYNKPLKIGRLTDGSDVSGTTQNTLVLALNDNVGIRRLVPSYDLDVNGTVGACNFYENGVQLSDKYVQINGDDVTGDIALSNNKVIEFGKYVTGKETNAGKIGYQKFTADALDIVGAGSSLSTRSVKIWDNLNTYGTISEAGTLLSTKYAQSNTLSNYLLKLQPETTATFKSIAGPGGIQTGLIVDNTNVNYASGAAISLSTGSNWRGRLYQDTQGDGNHMKVDLSSGGNSNYVTALDVCNFGGNIRATVANLYVNDFSFGTDYVGIAHSAVTSNAYALLQNASGTTFLNCASNAGIGFTQDRTSNIAYFSKKDWGIGGSISGKPDSYSGQGGGPFTKCKGWQTVANVGGTWCADVPVYSSTNGIFPNSDMENNAFNGLLYVYFSGGSNALESAMCTYYITNVYSYGIQAYFKTKDERSLTLGTTGLVGSSTIRTTVSEQYISYCWRFEGAA